MKKILKPYWLFLSVTLPQIILAIVFFRMLNIIGSELSEEAISYWRIYSISLGIMVLLATGYAIYKTVNKKLINKIDIGILLVAYLAYVYALLYDFSWIIPRDIPEWMFFDMNPLLLVAVCFMPVFMYCITAAVAIFAPKEGRAIWKDIVIMVCIPVGFYIFAQLLFLLSTFIDWDIFYDSEIFIHLFIVLVVAVTISFIFFMMRVILQLFNKKKKSLRLFSIIAAIALPIAGLVLNQFVFENVVGDYSSIYFYIILAVTGVLLLLPEFENLTAKIIVFSLKSMCYAYTLYFFVVMLPFIPLAMVMTFLLGLGFLLLAPTLLILVHTRSIAEDYKSIKAKIENKKSMYKIVLLFSACLLVLPSIMVLSFYHDRHTVNTALEYVYEEGYEYSDTVRISPSSLKRTLASLEKTTTNTRMVELYNNTPFIGSLYNKIVLDNATLSQSKMDTLSKIFLGQEWEESEDDDFWFTTVSIANDDFPEVIIKDYQIETSYNSQQGHYTSWIHFDLENTGSGQKQYFTEFTLPTGCYISDYYLYVNDEKKMGMITDKRAANWIYEQIVSVRRDPGILTYVADDVINFRVFPFFSDEVRQTGIEFVHDYPVNLTIDDIDFKLGTQVAPESIVELGESITYIPANLKADYPQIKRKPEYYFVIDTSANAHDNINDYINSVDNFIDDNNIDRENIVYFMTNSNVSVLSQDWQVDDYIQDNKFKGGFFADRAVKMILYNNYINPSNSYPVIIVVTDNLISTVMLKDYDDLRFTMPDSEYINFLNSDNELYAYSLKHETGEATTFTRIAGQQKSVIAYPNTQNPIAYLSVDYEGEIILQGNVDTALLDEAQNKWQSGLILDAMNMEISLRTAERNLQSLNVVIGSIKSRVMSPLTSFIVLETEAQEKALLEKQEQLLKSGKMYLSDDADDMMKMSEPPFWLLMVLVVGFVFYRRYKNSLKAKL